MNYTYEDLLTEFISFKSISADISFLQHSIDCANWLTKLLTDSGFQVKVFKEEPANPVVYASYHYHDKAKTILIYGHYDVQPASQSDGWLSDPFTLTKRDVRYYARGVMDNKGQILIHIYQAIQLIKSKKIRVNLKFLIEGNEESGSGFLPEIVRNNKAALYCDHLIISDGDIIDNHPVLEAGLRGVCNGTLVYKTANSAVHSGSYGNTIPNAAHEISRLVSKLFDTDEDIIIPGFYADIPKTILSELPMTKDNIGHKAGVRKIFVKDNNTFHNKIGNQPALVVTGISTGYVGVGYANIVPSNATLNFNIRFGQQQDPEKVIKTVQDFIKKATPNYVDYELNFTSFVKAEKLDVDSNFIKKVTTALERIYQQSLIVKYVGGTLPIINSFKEVLGSDPISIPLANDDANMHGLNENLKISNIKLGLEFSNWLLTQETE